MKQLTTLFRKFRITVAAIALCLCLPVVQADETPTVPLGYVTLTAVAGTGTVTSATLLSIPLYGPMTGDGQMTGQLTSLSASTLTNTSAGWTPGQLSTPAAPSLIKITSGAATGRTFLISTTAPNTATTVTIDAKDVAQGNLDTLSIAAGDTYEILPCDTLGSLFGTPATTGVMGGTGVNAGDSLVIATNGQLETFFYNTTLNRWAKAALGNPDATNTPLRPDSGIWYYRLAATDLKLIIPGRVSTTGRTTAVKNSGSTFLAQNWPVDMTLLAAGIHQIPTWTASASESTADTVEILINGEIHTYWFDGINWREQASGSPIADNVAIPAGTAVFLKKLGTATGYSPLTQPLPYSLN